MNYGSDGAVIKQCQRCGKMLRIENYFAACPMKYCRECAARSKAEKTAECLREMRRKARERNQLIKEQNRLLTDENELLREQLRAMQSRIDVLDALRRKEHVK